MRKVDFLNMLPHAIRIDADARAIACAVQQEIDLLVHEANAIIAGITLKEGAPGFVLDVMAHDLDSPLYEKDMTDSEKLNAIVSGKLLRSRAGTVGAVKSAIRVISSTVKLREEDGFRAALIPGEGDDGATMQRALRAAESVAPIRSELRIGTRDDDMTPEATILSISGGRSL